MKKLTEIIIVTAIIALSLLLAIPSLHYPIDGDAVVYASLAKNIAEKGDYAIDGEFHSLYPPFFPLVSALFYAILRNASLAVKLCSIIFATASVAVTYLLSRKLGLGVKKSILVALLVVLNPWFVYYNSIGYSEGLAIFLLMLSIYFYYLKEEKGWHIYASATCIGLGAITRAALIPFLLVFLIRCAYNLMKNKDLREIALIAIAGLPIAIWFLIVRLRLKAAPFGVYTKTMMIIGNIHLNVLIYALVIPITLLFISPLVISSVQRLLHNLRAGWKKDESTYFFLACIVIYLALVIWASFDVASFGILQDGRINLMNLYSVFFALPRYIIPIMPILTIWSLRHSDPKLTGFFIRIAPIIIIASLMFTAIVNYGSMQDLIDRHGYFPDTVMRRNEHRAQAIDWINDKAPKGSIIQAGLGEPEPVKGRMIAVNVLIKDHFRSDLDIISCTGDKARYPRKDAVDYIISDGTGICGTASGEVAYRTAEPPFVYVIRPYTPTSVLPQ
jgi:4-amino-4-deoxy-L-arabinose transferase-like glycosyltransferase